MSGMEKSFLRGGNYDVDHDVNSEGDVCIHIQISKHRMGGTAGIDNVVEAVTVHQAPQTAQSVGEGGEKQHVSAEQAHSKESKCKKDGKHPCQEGDKAGCGCIKRRNKAIKVWIWLEKTQNADPEAKGTDAGAELVGPQCRGIGSGIVGREQDGDEG